MNLNHVGAWALLLAAVSTVVLWEGGRRGLPASPARLDRLLGRVFAGTRLARTRSLLAYRERLAADHADASLPPRLETDEALPFADTDRAVVLGGPGAGKSTLLRHFLLSWARDPGWRRERVPVLVELHRVAGDGRALEEHVVGGFAECGLPGADGFVRHALAAGGLTVLFDGLDEVASAERHRVSRALRSFAVRHPRCRVVVTCRTAAHHRALAPEITAAFHVAELDDRDLRGHLLRWAGDDPAEAERLLAALRESPAALRTARNPLLLGMITRLRSARGDADAALPLSAAECHERVITALLDDRRDRFEPAVKRTVLTGLALTAMRARGRREHRTVEHATAIAEATAALSRAGLPGDSAAPLLDEVVDGSGLLVRAHGGFAFPHTGVPEYLVAVSARSDPDGLLAHYRADPDTWREVVRFWCGLVRTQTGPVVEAVFAVDPVLAFACLAEARVLDIAVADRITDHFRAALTADAETVRAFGRVAADPRPRGQVVLAFLISAVQAGVPEAHRALAATGLPRAAMVLAHHLDAAPAAPALATMGDLAVPALAARADRDDPGPVVDALAAVGTPAAAAALVPLLRRDGPVRHLAAWRLAGLLADPEVEAALAELDVPAEDSPYDWVPAPFGGPTALTALVARLCAEAGDLPPGRVDGRIGVALLVAAPADDLRTALAGARTAESFDEEVRREGTTALPDPARRVYLALDRPLRLDLVDRLRGPRADRLPVDPGDWAELAEPPLASRFRGGPAHRLLVVLLAVVTLAEAVGGLVLLLGGGWRTDPAWLGYPLLGLVVAASLVELAAVRRWRRDAGAYLGAFLVVPLVVAVAAGPWPALGTAAAVLVLGAAVVVPARCRVAGDPLRGLLHRAQASAPTSR